MCVAETSFSPKEGHRSELDGERGTFHAQSLDYHLNCDDVMELLPDPVIHP